MTYIEHIAARTGTDADHWVVDAERVIGNSQPMYIRWGPEGKFIIGGTLYDVYRNPGLHLIAIVDRKPGNQTQLSVIDVQTMRHIVNESMTAKH